MCVVTIFGSLCKPSIFVSRRIKRDTLSSATSSQPKLTTAALQAAETDKNFHPYLEFFENEISRKKGRASFS